MHVVRHQAVGDDARVCFLGELVDQVEIEAVVVVFEKDRLAAVAALGDVVRRFGQDDAGEAGHWSQVL